MLATAGDNQTFSIINQLLLLILGQCRNGCKEPILFYDTLQCKPVFASPKDCCPSKYNCPHIEARARATAAKCYFSRKVYDLGESIKDNEVYGNCQTGCTCRKKYNGNMIFSCPALDCPEWLGRKPKPGCHFKYKLDACCGGAEVCPPFSTTCKVGGTFYSEGQRFDAPNNKCTKCVCQEGFKGKFEAPFCRKWQCIEEVHRQTEVKNFCAPIFIALDDCCPWNWVCPRRDDNIIKAATPSKHPSLKCKFGKRELNIGDKVQRITGKNGKLSCECRIPPYLTCIRNLRYYSISRGFN